jgi:acyl-CoA reductase-like NAD-dependent aldehyde dehydrogenase
MKPIPVLKTYKLYIGGAFPRTESGRFYAVSNKKGAPLANIGLSSRKDFRNAVVAARKAQEGWAARAAFNRSQILYRIAEMLEGRSAQFEKELTSMGWSAAAAKREIQSSIDTWVYYAGWCDKYQALYSSVNPVSSGHFNFSVHEPTGVVALVAPESAPLAGLCTLLAAVISGGNSAVVLVSEQFPLCAITLAEVLATSDLPGGVVNLLTGSPKELLPHMSTHMDVNALCIARDAIPTEEAEKNCALNIKRFTHFIEGDLRGEKGLKPHLITAFCELKTTWHPIEYTDAASGGY